MNAKAFVDTNVCIYLYSEDEASKSKLAAIAMKTHHCVISTQVLNEFSNVYLNKLHKTSAEIKAALDELREACAVLPITNATIDKALELHVAYGYHYYDCLMIASALESDCTYLLSEDMADGQIIEEKLHLANMFKTVTIPVA